MPKGKIMFLEKWLKEQLFYKKKIIVHKQNTPRLENKASQFLSCMSLGWEVGVGQVRFTVATEERKWIDRIDLVYPSIK